MTETLIIGAGLTGLACAYHSATPYLLLEKAQTPGGLCRSIEKDGFTFDYSGHFLHLHHDRTKEFIHSLMSKQILRIKRASSIYINDRIIPYPFQAHLFGLPAKVKEECLQGFLTKPDIPAHLQKDFYHWSLATFGEGITRHFMKPYNEKLWTVSARTLAADWVAPFVPQPTAEEVKKSASSDSTGNYGYNVYFYYPAKGGSQAFVNALLKKVKNIRCGESAVSVNYKKKQVETSSGTVIDYRNLVSTQPLPELLASMKDLPAPVADAAQRLNWNSVLCLNLGVRTARPAGETV